MRTFLSRLNQRVQKAAVFTSYRPEKRWVASRECISEQERKHLEQELPSRELLAELREVKQGACDPEDDIKVPGDSFGIMRNRISFYRPIPRTAYCDELGDFMPLSAHPSECFNKDTIRCLQYRFGSSAKEVVAILRNSHGDINCAVKELEAKHGAVMQFGAYGVVCMESYAPEAFCLVSFNLSSYESTQDDDVLDAIHELTLSAAELPLDTPKHLLIDKFLNEWTIEDGTPCSEVMKEANITISSIILLPHGDYSVQGFHILNPVKESVPNIGTAAAACCFDLRTGIHNRFRFHVERIADSFSEHIVQEMCHYNQGVHILRQPFWFRPEYSVEEYLRFKESLLQPSASLYEIRYSFLFAQMYNLPHHSNIIEMEKLKVAQHKYEKHYEDFTAPGKWVTSDGANLQTVAAAGGGSNVPGGAMHYHANDSHTIDSAMETHAGPLRNALAESMQRHGDRVFAKFYRNNFF